MFINSSWVIFAQIMRVVIFLAMCHHSLGHEKKALLSAQSKAKREEKSGEKLHKT